MTDSVFSAHVRAQAALAMIDLAGDINAFASEALNQAYSEAEALHPKAVILNFVQVGYINSTGIALIVGLLARAQKADCRMVVYGLSDHYLEIFKITRLSDFITITTDESGAVEAAL